MDAGAIPKEYGGTNTAPYPQTTVASAAARLPAVVIDCGTGYTKMGYAGNSSPNYIRARAHRARARRDER